jgi:putative transposase
VKAYNKKELQKLPSAKCSHHTVTLKYQRPRRYYMLIPLVTKKKENKSKKSIAFGPGVTTFQTGFPSDGNFVEYRKGDIKMLFVLGKEMHKLQSRIDKHYKASYLNKKDTIKYKNGRKKWRKKMDKVTLRIKNLRRDMHWKISRDVVQEYKHIIISRFQASYMVKRMSRKINSETVRKMLQWSHFEFRQRLKHKAEEFGSVVHEVEEHYSNKGCG